ncbi:MAG: NlpC/P60 family protein [candidate division Zixibacteria bacterium]|nr:NlpC/P60 family protein [candidate division Zixibacteria bacterium]
MTTKKNFVLLLILMTFVGCVSQPRYTSYPIERKSPSPLEEKDQSKKETLSFEEESQTKIDQVKMAQIIESFLGTPYEKGGASKNGIDCSGFVVEVYKRYAGFILPHNTEKLFKLVKKVDKEKLGYGDLVFFSDFGFSPSHVGIYIGEGKFVHSAEGYGVIVSSLDDEHYRKSYIGARRVIP